MTTINISDDYTITNYSASLGDNKVRDPGNDTTAATASCPFSINENVASMLNAGGGRTITFEDTNGLQKTYIFDTDGDGDTGTVDGSGRIRVQITDGGASAGLQLRAAVHGNTGHDGSLIITQLAGADFKIEQRDAGASGNTTISGTTISNSQIQAGNGGGSNIFSGGISDTTAYKNADVIPHKFSIKGIPNLRGQTVTSRYKVFLGEEKS